MANLLEDAELVQRLISYLVSTNDIIEFMNSVPPDKWHLRKQITLRHFLKLKDSSGYNLQMDIENEAKDIINIFPNFPYNEAVRRLCVLGNMPFRTEVLVRELLNENKDSIPDVNQKPANVCDSGRNIKIKIKKLDGTLQVFSNNGNKSVTVPQPTMSVREESSADSTIDRALKRPRDEVPPLEPDVLVKRSPPSENQNDQTCMLNSIGAEVEVPSEYNSSQSSHLQLSISPSSSSSGTILISNKSGSTDMDDTLSFGSDMSEVAPSNSSDHVSSLDDTQTSDGTTNTLLSDMIGRIASPDYFDDLSRKEFNELIDLTNTEPDSSTTPIEAGPSTSSASAIDVKTQELKPLDIKLVNRLCEMFPQSCPEYVKSICKNKEWKDFDLVLEIILSNPDHPKRPEKPPSPLEKQIDPEEQLEIVKAVLPDADPTFLRIKCESLGYDPNLITEFLNMAREQKNYPTMKEYLRKQQFNAQAKQYTTEFNAENFLEIFPEPEKTFNDPKRTITVDAYSMHYIKHFFENKFNKLHKKTIWKALSDFNYKIVKTDDYLENVLKNNITMKSQRKKLNPPEPVQNILVLQEIAYVAHRAEIHQLMEQKRQQLAYEREYAKNNGLMNTCGCCYDDEVMPKDTFTCPKEHKFCRDCIKRSCDVAMGDGKTEYKCLSGCDEEFTMITLQNVLPKKMFSKLAQKKTLAEVKAAGLEELESCPFCDFANIPNPQDKVFRCFNPDCMKESCRQCKEPSHLPLRCDEVEKDENVKARTHIENKMTEALLRKCWKCGTRFLKEEGCNKMTCTCGASMCYICQKPVKDYSHFNGMGGDKYHLCPLYSDTNEMNKMNVMAAAKAAKEEVEASKLKVDPALNIEKHFDERKKTTGAMPNLVPLGFAGAFDNMYPHPAPVHIVNIHANAHANAHANVHANVHRHAQIHALAHARAHARARVRRQDARMRANNHYMHMIYQIAQGQARPVNEPGRAQQQEHEPPVW